MTSANSTGTTKKFLEYAKPDERGWTKIITIDELNRHFNTNEFTTQNGGAWCRSDTPLLSQYNVERYKGTVINSQGKKTQKIISIQLRGIKESFANLAIRNDIKKAIKALKCAILVTANDIQVDHKCPRIELTPLVGDTATQVQSDFQALCRVANSAKRGHCMDCKNTKKRFDAKILGYSVSQWQGGSVFKKSCVGCYWYDPVEFNAQVSKGFIPIKSQ
jgi:5-methylcytosine-specific restriction endonuclease McrA